MKGRSTRQQEQLRALRRADEAQHGFLAKAFKAECRKLSGEAPEWPVEGGKKKNGEKEGGQPNQHRYQFSENSRPEKIVQSGRKDEAEADEEDEARIQKDRQSNEEVAGEKEVLRRRTEFNMELKGGAALVINQESGKDKNDERLEKLFMRGGLPVEPESKR